MNEQDYIDKIYTQWPSRTEDFLEVAEVPQALFQLADEAVAAFPHSAQLWDMLGDLIQSGDAKSQYSLADALVSYRRAIAANASYGPAYESIGYFHDVIDENFPSAEQAFRRAIELGEGKNSYYGLARVLAEQGKKKEALALLTPENCPFHIESEIEILLSEIKRGLW